MSDVSELTPSASFDELRVVVSTDKPLPAKELGELLTKIASDYRKQNRGRTLVVARVESGSILSIFRDLASYTQDAAEIAKAANAIKRFGDTIWGLISETKKHPSSTADHQFTGMRSVEKMLQIAAESGNEVDFKHVSANGDTTEIKITPIEAVEIREKADSLKKRMPRPIEVSDLLSVGHRPDEIAGLLAGIGGSGSINSETRAVIRMFVGVLYVAGQKALLHSVTLQLSAQGHAHLANFIKEEMRKYGEETEPPLLA